MKALVVAQHGQIRDALEKQLTIRNRAHLCVDPEWLASAGDSAIPKALKIPSGIGIVVNTASFESVEQAVDDVLTVGLEQLAGVCVRRNLPLIQLSSSKVFDGLQGGVHRELEAASSASEQGKMLLRMEGMVSSVCQRHIVLRTGPLFSSMEDNLLTRLLESFEGAKTLALSDSGESCPIHVSDMARVVSAIIDQLSCGAEVWGTYHYCSADYVTHYQFAATLWEAVSHYKKAVARAPTLKPLDDVDGDWQSPLLNCEKILNTFGIKQLPWRAFIAPTVKKYFNPGMEQNEPLLTQSIQPVQKENFDG